MRSHGLKNKLFKIRIGYIKGLCSTYGLRRRDRLILVYPIVVLRNCDEKNN